MRLENAIVVGIVVSLLAVPARAQRRGRGGESQAATQESAAPSTRPASDKEESDHLSVTDHEITVHGQAIKYRATAGTLVVRDESGKAKANMFFVAYEKQPVPDDRSTRPITYLFNGGPGSSAVWLHLGAAGPRRVGLNDMGGPPAPPYHMVDNQDTWLVASDLVFIDPVGTGYSRPAPGEDPKQFYASKTTCVPSRSSSACTRPVMSDGNRPSFWPAKATAPPAPPRFPTSCLKTASASMESS